MSAPHPTHLKPPSFNSFPLIQVKFENDPKGLGIPDQTLQTTLINNDGEFLKAHFDRASSVVMSRINAVRNLSEKTFDGLCQALEPMYSGIGIENKAKLQSVALSEQPEFEQQDIVPSIDQIECFLMSQTLVSPYAHWGRIADLYNSSDVTQQKALLTYFELIMNRDLVDLFSVQEPELELPPSLLETYETRILNGSTYIQDDERQALVREDIFMNRYRVVMTDAEGFECLMFGAPSIAMAVAKGVAYLKDPTNLRFAELSIIEDDVGLIATGRIDNLLGWPMRDAKVRWDLEAYEIKKSFDATVNAVDQAIANHPGTGAKKVNDHEDGNPTMIWTRTTGFRPGSDEEICARWVAEQESGPIGIDHLVKAFLLKNPHYVPSVPAFGVPKFPTKLKWARVSGLMVMANQFNAHGDPHLYPEYMLNRDFTPSIVTEFKDYAKELGITLLALPLPTKNLEPDDGFSL